MAVTVVNCDYCGGTGVYSDEEYEQVDCDMCEGTGCVEKELDGCVCAAREPFECCCGGFDDVDLDEWYGDDE